MVLRTDVAGMPLEWIDYKEAARLYHQEQVAYTCGSLLYELYGGVNARTGRRTVLEVNSIVATVGHTGNPGNTRHDYVPPLNNQTLFRRDAYLCMYCGARFPSRELSRDHIRPFSQGGVDIWTNVVTACRRCNNQKASRTPEQAKMQLIAVPFTPTYAEYIFLKGRRVLADQMEYLLAHFPRSSPLHDRIQRWLLMLTWRRTERSGARLPHRRLLLRLPRLPLAAARHAATATATRRMRCSASRASSRSDRAGAAELHRGRLRPEPRGELLPQPHLSGLQGQPRARAGRPGAAVRALPRVVPAPRSRRVRDPEYEADDIIGTLAARSRAMPACARLVTRDKDLAQLMRDGDVFWDFSARALSATTISSAHFGVLPERFADYLALTGDEVDNIPGVPGIGKKTAAEFSRIFGSLDEMYADLGRVAPLKLRGAAAVAARLLAHKESAYLARRLTGIVCDIPLKATLDDLKPRPPDRGRLESFFDAHGFGNILRQQARRIAGD